MSAAQDHRLPVEKQTIRDADEKWGCAHGWCPDPARFIVTSSEGNEWGACRKHIKEVRCAAA